MSKIPVRLSEAQFERHIRPHLSTAKRGFVCKIPLFKVFNYILYRLHTGCQWSELPIERARDSEKKELTYHAVYYHYRKWSTDGSLKKVWIASILAIQGDLNLSEINLDGTHTIAKKGARRFSIRVEKEPKHPIFFRWWSETDTSLPLLRL